MLDAYQDYLNDSESVFDSELLFVYGTMKTGFRNHDRISTDIDTIYLGEAMTEPNFQMKSKSVGNYIAPVVLEGKNSIQGELYEISPSLLEYVDLMEGCPNVYQRIKVKIPFSGFSAWMYVVKEDKETFNNHRVIVKNNTHEFVVS